MNMLKIFSFILLIAGSSSLLSLPTELERLKDPEKRQALLGHMQWVTNAVQTANAARATQELHQQATRVAGGCQYLQNPLSRAIIKRTTGTTDAELQQFVKQCETFHATFNQFMQRCNQA